MHTSSGNDRSGRPAHADGAARESQASPFAFATDHGSAAGGPHGAARPRRPIPPKLYRISELVEYSGVSRQTIHNYTTMGLLRESQSTRGGHRLYGEAVFERLDVIAALKAERKPMEYIREYFAQMDGRTYGQGAPPREHGTEPL